MASTNRREFVRSIGVGSVAGIAGLTVGGAALADWPAWRGPSRDGLVSPDAKWPAELTDNNFRRVWRVELGPSYSGPIVSGNLVFATQTVESKRETVQAFDRSTGKQVWETEWVGSLSVPFFARSNGSWIRSTPAVSGTDLFVGGIRDVLVCLDANTGETKWKTDFVKELETPLPAFGFVCSPLVVDDAVYVQAGGGLAKVERATGKLLWRSLADGGGMWGSAFSSPVMAKLAGKEQVVVQTREKLAGVDPADGSVLWEEKIPAFRGMNILTPTVWNDSIFTSSYGGKSLLLKVTREGNAFSVEQVWENKVQAYMSSPVVWNDHAYVHLKNQRFACIDLKSGKEKWVTKPFGKYWSMAANGDRLLALDQTGDLFHIQMDPSEFKLLSRRTVSEAEAWAHLAVTDGQVIIRELNALAVYDWG